MTTDRTLGQAAYEKYGQVFRRGRVIPWGLLRATERAGWEAVATAVVEECGGSDG